MIGSKKIQFVASKKSMIDVWPHPKHATQFIPDEYKKMPRHNEKNLHNPTVKTCMPFLDSLIAGYIIPFDQDYVIDPSTEVEKDTNKVIQKFDISPANGEQDDIGFHDITQLPVSWRESHGDRAGKFINKWLIKTPPGYSCLFLKPMNRLESRFDIISGIVDTDTYINLINFPFLVKEKKQFLVKKGEPMVQVIPFKRESWKMWSGFYWEKLHNKTLSLLNSVFIDRYKTMFWRKKSFK